MGGNEAEVAVGEGEGRVAGEDGIFTDDVERGEGKDEGKDGGTDEGKD